MEKKHNENPLNSLSGAVQLNSNFKLAYLAIGDIYKFPPVIFLHGIMGGKKYLENFVKKFLAECPKNSAIIFDMRNHGESSKSWAPYTVEACALDIKQACGVLGLEPICVIGHSFGGKVALICAGVMPSITSAWLLDTALGIVAKNNPGFSTLQVVDALEQISWPKASRKDLVDELLSLGVTLQIALWMTTNVYEVEDGLRLLFQPREIKALLHDFLTLDGWPLIESISQIKDIHVVSAEFGYRLEARDHARLNNMSQNHHLFFHLLKNASHFLMNDNPSGLIEMLKPHFVN